MQTNCLSFIEVNWFVNNYTEEITIINLVLCTWNCTQITLNYYETAEGWCHQSKHLYKYLSVCLFVHSKRQNHDTDWRQMLRNYEEWPGKCPLRIELAVLVFSERYRDISSFLFVADRHFYFSHFHFWLLPRRLTQCAFAKRCQPCPTSLLIVRPTKKTFTSQTRMLCLRPTN